MATLQPLPLGTAAVEPRLRGQQAARGAAVSIKSHSSTSDLDLALLEVRKTNFGAITAQHVETSQETEPSTTCGLTQWV